MLELQLLVLLLIANGVPILARLICGNRLAYPVDGNLMLPDGKPLFGRSKTIRGILTSIAATTLFSLLILSSWQVGLVVALFSMMGDLFSSFTKRRLGLPSSSHALGLDQIPESLFPLLACQPILALAWIDLVWLVILFFLAELLLSRLLFHLRIRRRPY